MGKLIFALVVLSVLCAVLAEDTTTEAETTTIAPMPTRSVQGSTAPPDLEHKINETMETAKAAAEKNVQEEKNSGTAKILSSGLVVAVLFLCASF